MKDPAGGQEKLWLEYFEDALIALVYRIGGPKDVGLRFWPEMDAEDAGRKLMHCLDRGRGEKLSLKQIVMLLQWGREAGCHVAMAFLAEHVGYEAPAPSNPQTRLEGLLHEFNSKADAMSQLADEIRSVAPRLRMVGP